MTLYTVKIALIAINIINLFVNVFNNFRTFTVLETSSIFLIFIGKNNIFELSLMIITIILLAFDDDNRLLYFKEHIHKIRINNFSHNFLVLAEQDFNNLFFMLFGVVG